MVAVGRKKVLEFFKELMVLMVNVMNYVNINDHDNRINSNSMLQQY